MELNGKKALVIGASRGIGAAIALTFAREGAEVMLAGRNKNALQPILESIQSLPGKAGIIEWDICGLVSI